jgi:hypothetical protein
MFETKNRTERNENMSAKLNYKLQSPRKLVRGVAIFTLAFGLSAAGISGSMATSSPASPLDYATISAGDTLWELAAIHAPDQDPRDWISDVVSLNALQSIDLEPGQRIALPR